MAEINHIAKLEIQHQDANHALFMVLTECCSMIIEGDETAQGATVAKNIRASGKSKMANKEIAECAYRLTAQLRSWKGPHAATVKRILMQLVAADRWEAKLREGTSASVDV